jgi:hypothetical protein
MCDCPGFANDPFGFAERLLPMALLGLLFRES